MEHTLYADEVTAGMPVPVFALPLTPQRLVMEAASNRDFAPIHHDAEFARQTGAPTMYANTMLVQAMFDATLRQWMGLGGRLRVLDISMRSFSCAGEVLACEGRVEQVRTQGTESLADVELWATAGGRRSVTGRATVVLPRDRPGRPG